MSQKRSVLIFGVLAVAWLLVPIQAFAQASPGGKAFQASLKETVSYSTNPLLVTSGASSLWGSTTSPGLAYTSATPIAQLRLGTRVDQNLFNQSAFNTTDLHGNGYLSRRSERWEMSLQGNADYDSTRTSELTTYSLRPIVARHLGVSGTPTLSFSPSQTSKFSVTGTVSTSTYDSRNFTNYLTYSVTPSYSRQFDPLNIGIVQVQARRYKATRGSGTKVDSISPTVGWQRTFSERLSGNLNVGGQISRQFNYGTPVNDWKPQYVFSGGLTFKGQQDNINISASRSQSSYGNGADALQTSVSVSDTHQINPNISLIGGVSYLMAEYQRASSGDLEALADGHGGIVYHLTPTVDVTADYRYRYETLTNLTKTAQDSTFMIGFVYRPGAWSLAD